MEIKERISKLRELMVQSNVDAYIVPSQDPHLSEYVGEHFKCRAWISGFTGSAGTAVFTKEKAGLWTDGRYYIQAEKQLKGTGIELFRAAEIGVPSYTQWLQSELKENNIVGFDGMVFSTSFAEKMEKDLWSKGIRINSDLDLISPIWTDRPEIPSDEIFLHHTKYCGKSRNEKVSQVREKMSKSGANYYLVSSLDDICWLLNIRGNDVSNNPFATAYCLVGERETFLFINKNKVNSSVERELMQSNVFVKDYDEIYNSLKELEDTSVIILDYDMVNYSLVESINKKVKKIHRPNLTTRMKAIKNDVEVQNIKDAYIKDGVALVQLFRWIRDNVENITEIDVVKKAEEFRRNQPLSMGPSFDSIAAYKENAAMMHYNPYNEETPRYLKEEGFFLLDSGGQYLNGTTDITRTISLGKLTDEERRDFTLVLKSVIALSTIKFLYGATGSNLDILARRPLWEYGIDYKCGTGHGIGFFSNVHEQPQRFSQVPNNIKLEKGMMITIEPGVYKEGRHGVRTENTVVVVEDEKTEFGQFMRFEELCYVPIDRSAILPEMLTEFEKEWLNNYHDKVFKTLSPYLDENCKQWLLRETEKL
ncbi:aminopeptidase P family protein [Clostridium sp. UBA4548]|uniref:aminopeptidase P family protein n=1 Tax=Clostridium sp. UBA4548 TaxID=1946361 RepID=UPI0025BF7478|nr:aminopeptidase P family protein [Clostridium sp. UBA4548]